MNSRDTKTSPASASHELRGRSVGTKLGLVVAVLVIALGVIAALELSTRERNNLIQAKQISADRVMRLFTLSVYPALDFDDEIAVAESLDRLTRDPEVIAAFVWARDPDTDAPRASFVREPGEASAGPSPRRDVSGVSFEVDDERLTAHAAILDDSGALLGHAQVSWSLLREQAAFADARRLIFIGTSVGVALMISLIIAATQLIIVRPLARLEDAAVALGAGQPVAVETGARDEVGRLARVFTDMSAAIVDRETRLRDAHNQLATLFDNMRQAIVSVDGERKVQGRASRAAHELFDEAELEGRDLCELLVSKLDEDDTERVAFELWLDAAIGADEASWPELAALAPDELAIPSDQEDEDGDDTIELRLEFRPLFESGRVSRLMLLATDESEQRRLEREVRARESAHEVEMKAMRRIVASGTLPFAAFLRSSAARLDRMGALLEDPTRPRPDPIHHELFRHAHTIKGEARTFSLIDLERGAAALEDTLERTRREDADHLELDARLRRELEAARDALAASRQRLVEASPLGEEILDQVTVAASDLTRVRELVRLASPTLRAAVDDLASRPFAECIAGLVDAAPTWAAARGKRVRLDLHGEAVRVPASLAEVLRGCITHLVRNAIAHGIEDEGDRLANAKPSVGVVGLHARALDRRGVEVLVTDDGRGIALRPDSSPSSDSDPHAWVFEAGTTTLAGVDELAGRGVGLAAVRREFDEVGYVIDVAATGASGTTLRIRPRA